MAINRLDTKGWWAVNGTPIYVPATCKVEHSNITGSSTGRSEDGVMRIDWVRRDVVKVYLAYKAMTAEEVAYMENLMQGKEFVFTYRDKGQTKTANCYVGESGYDFYTHADGLGEIYTNFTMNVIEK